MVIRQLSRDRSVTAAWRLAPWIPWVMVALAACSSPTERADSLVQRLGFRKSLVEGTGFLHVVYDNAKPLRHGRLHVYIDGDGTPYAGPTTPASDPTPRNLLVLRLMAIDPAGSVYVSRPCYFASQPDGACTRALWTTARYGPRVLSSMEAVLRQELARRGATSVELFGLSGGGVLAVLMAQRIDIVSRVVTVGANLDIDAWCDLHRYSRLVGSVNPVRQPPLRSDIDVLHLVGELDTNTPPDFLKEAARQRGERVRVVERFDHGCCWESIWPSVVPDSQDH